MTPSKFLTLLLVLFLSGCYTFEYDPTGGKDMTSDLVALDMGEDVAGDMSGDMVEDVAEDPPPTVTITLPDPGAQVQNDVRLVAVALDKDRNNITSDIVWVRNGSAFQVGGDVTHTFELGPQTVTARVTDAAGKIGESEISFEVIE